MIVASVIRKNVARVKRRLPMPRRLRRYRSLPDIASCVSDLLDIDANEMSPALLREALLKSGAVVLRNAIPKPVIEPLALTVEQMLTHFDAIPPEVLRTELQFEDHNRRGVWQEILIDGVHYNYDLITFSQGRHSLYDPFRRSSLQSLLKGAWPEKRVIEHHATNVRRMWPARSNGYSDTPLATHVDAMFHQHDRLVVNFWTPLTEAGGDAPGLAVIPLGLETTKAFLEFDPAGYYLRAGDFANMNNFRHEKLTPDGLVDSGLSKSFKRPKLRPGDVLALTNFTIHATSVEPQMTRSRTSVEVRVNVID